MKYSFTGSTGGMIPNPPAFTPWLPSTWPVVPSGDTAELWRILNEIVQETVIVEIGNVISDAQTVNGDVQRRGHVVALAIVCAIDALASYAFEGAGVGRRYKTYIQEFFPASYQARAAGLYKLYRNCLVHSWNLFEVSIYPDDKSIEENGGIISVGLLNFFAALEESVRNVGTRFVTDVDLQNSCRRRYEKLRSTAKR